ncbi:MAG: hypothetical protein DWQ09_03400 [Proteobacteria bacterium]|nr:MAG: hypothetical protein DWQ09_03400 [Pseudomonadota bacterium]QKK11056.1 MAG: hypothetical protein HND59_05035 [Pseudomonadota bacterium]
MVIVFDMRTGEVIEQSVLDTDAAMADSRKRAESPRVSAALQWVEHDQAHPATRVLPAVLPGCYFDESGD